MKILTALLSFLLLLGCADPALSRPRHGGIANGSVPPTPPFPTTQTIAFGAKTLIGAGGSDLGYTNQALLGVSRWLKVTSQVNNVAAGVSLFGVDDRNMLVPCLAVNGSGKCTSTYAANTWGSPAAGPYTVVVAEYSNSGRTVATGNVSTVTVNITANEATVREMTLAAMGCTVNCEVDNPDGGVGSTPGSVSNPQIFQAGYLLSGFGCATTTIINKGQTVKWRTGYFDPTTDAYEILLPGAAYTGAGVITITSESQDSYPTLNNGAQIGAIQTKATCYGDNFVPYVVDHLYFNQQQNSTTARGFWSPTDINSYGVIIQYSQFQTGCSVTVPMGAGFLSNGSGGALIADHNYIHECSTSSTSADGSNGISVDSGSHPGGLITWNIGKYMRDDFIDEGCGPFTVDDNFVTNTAVFEQFIKHPDVDQNNGCGAGVNTSGGEHMRNIGVRGQVAVPGMPDEQGWAFYRNTGPSGTATFTNHVMKNNINNFMTQAGIFMQNMITPTIELNLSIAPTGLTITPPALPQGQLIEFPAGSGSATGGTFKFNTANGYDFSGQGGSPVTTPNKTIAYTPSSPASIYTGCFPNYVGGENPNLDTRIKVIDFFTPGVQTAGTLCRDSSGVYQLPLTPADSSGHACWNVDTLTAFNPALTCAAQGLTQAS